MLHTYAGTFTIKPFFDNVVMEISGEFGPTNAWLRKLICCHGNCHGSRVGYFLTSWPHMKRGVFPSCYYLPFRLGSGKEVLHKFRLLVQCLFAVTSLSSVPSPSFSPTSPSPSLSLSLPPHLFSIHHPSFTLNLHKLLCCLSPSAPCPCTTRASSRPLAPQRCFIYFNLIWCYLI